MSRVLAARTGNLFCQTVLMALGGVMIARADLPKMEPRGVWMQRSKEMVRTQLIPRGITNPRVLKAMAETPRHAFVDQSRTANAYDDTPLPIASGQTISQPYVVALMTELLELRGHEKVLEVGTGSGYQAAILAQLSRHVLTIEIIPNLARSARARLRKLGYQNVTVRCGNGYEGWSDQAPFDAIILTAAPTELPPALLEQLAMGGRMVAPVGDVFQEIVIVRKTPTGFVTEHSIGVRFVPMVKDRSQND